MDKVQKDAEHKKNAKTKKKQKQIRSMKTNEHKHQLCIIARDQLKYICLTVIEDYRYKDLYIWPTG